MSLEAYFDANRANWNERVAIHVKSKSYDVPGFLAGATTLDPVDIEGLGNVAGKTLVHLQCHFGMDTLSWARLGAHVTGLDFAPDAIATAHDLARQAGLDARFVEANVYNAIEALSGEQFDIVFTGVGALCWLPDVRRWAQVVGALLKPGGTFYIREFHPVLWTLDDEEPEQRLLIRYPYFETSEPLAWDDEVTYTDDPEGRGLTNTRNYEWNHALSEIITALMDAGLQLEEFREFDWCDSAVLPWMVQISPGRWALPEGRERLPLAYAIRARKK
jgi:SAM-dependent methyltransferase